MDVSQQDLQDFAADIGRAATERGVQLTPDMVREVFAATTATDTFNPAGTRAALDSMLAGQGVDVDPDDIYEDEPDDEPPEDPADSPGMQRLAYDFQHDTAELQKRLGRKLTKPELDHLSGVALDQAARHGAIDIDGAYAERQAQLDTTAGRNALFRQRAEEHAATMREARSERNATREFDLDNPGDRQDYLLARAAGEEFEDSWGGE